MIRILHVFLILGVISILISFIIPQFKNNDFEEVQTLENKFMNQEVNESEFQKQYLELTTIKYKILNLGVGIVTVTISLIIFLLIFKVKNFTDLKRVHSIYNIFLYFLFSNLAQLFISLGFIGSLITEDKQYPIYDNSGIALVGYISFLLVTLIIINISLIPLVLIKRVKSSIFDHKLFRKKNKVSDFIWSILLTFNIVILILSVYYGVILSIVGSLLAIYVILSFRSEYISNEAVSNVCA